MKFNKIVFMPLAVTAMGLTSCNTIAGRTITRSEAADIAAKFIANQEKNYNDKDRYANLIQTNVIEYNGNRNLTLGNGQISGSAYINLETNINSSSPNEFYQSFKANVNNVGVIGINIDSSSDAAISVLGDLFRNSYHDASIFYQKEKVNNEEKGYQYIKDNTSQNAYKFESNNGPSYDAITERAYEAYKEGKVSVITPEDPEFNQSQMVIQKRQLFTSANNFVDLCGEYEDKAGNKTPCFDYLYNSIAISPNNTKSMIFKSTDENSFTCKFECHINKMLPVVLYTDFFSDISFFVNYFLMRVDNASIDDFAVNDLSFTMEFSVKDLMPEYLSLNYSASGLLNDTVFSEDYNAKTTFRYNDVVTADKNLSGYNIIEQKVE